MKAVVPVVENWVWTGLLIVQKRSSLGGNVITNICAQRTTSERRSGQRDHFRREGLQRWDTGVWDPETRALMGVGFGTKAGLQHKQVRSLLAWSPWGWCWAIWCDWFQFLWALALLTGLTLPACKTSFSSDQGKTAASGKLTKISLLVILLLCMSPPLHAYCPSRQWGITMSSPCPHFPSLERPWPSNVQFPSTFLAQPKSHVYPPFMRNCLPSEFHLRKKPGE